MPATACGFIFPWSDRVLSISEWGLTVMSNWQGFYSTAQVSRVARIPRRTLYDWKARNILRPSVQVLSSNGVVDEGYSYADLTIAKLMQALREDRLDLRSVGIALRHLFDRLGPPNQGWHDAHVYLVGNKVFAERSDEWETTTASQFGQKIETRMFGELFPLLREQEEAGSILVPTEFVRYVEINPDVMGGQPVVRDTRVPTAVLSALAEQGCSLAEMATLYAPIERRAIQAAIDYERALAQPVGAKAATAASTP